MQRIGMALCLCFALSVTAIHAETQQEGWIGVTITKVTPELAKSFELDKPKGVLVHEVDGPAKKAGMQRGDIITHFQGDPVLTTHDISARVARTPAGETVNLTLIRDGKEQGVQVVVEGRAFAGGEQKTYPMSPFAHGWRTTPAWAADGETLCRTYNRLVTKCVDQTCAELTISSRRELAVMMAKEVNRGVGAAADEERSWLSNEIITKCPQVR